MVLEGLLVLLLLLFLLGLLSPLACLGPLVLQLSVDLGVAVLGLVEVVFDIGQRLVDEWTGAFGVLVGPGNDLRDGVDCRLQQLHQVLAGALGIFQVFNGHDPTPGVIRLSEA